MKAIRIVQLASAVALCAYGVLSSQVAAACATCNCSLNTSDEGAVSYGTKQDNFFSGNWGTGTWVQGLTYSGSQILGANLAVGNNGGCVQGRGWDSGGTQHCFAEDTTNDGNSAASSCTAGTTTTTAHAEWCFCG